MRIQEKLKELLVKKSEIRKNTANIQGMSTPSHLGVLPQQVGVPMPAAKPMTTSFSVGDPNFKPAAPASAPSLPATGMVQRPVNTPPPANNFTGTNAFRSVAKQPMRTKTAEYSRNTGVVDVDGNVFVNSEDAELLGKLGFDVSNYRQLEKSGEVLDLYSYVEKIAEVPKAVSKAVDKGESFSGEYLKDMDYEVPKGYEVKGDLCCPVEKTEEEEKEPSEKTTTAEMIFKSSSIKAAGYNKKEKQGR
jgi:hypothetical protein